MLNLVVAALLQTQADTTVIVRGTVRDTAGRPLEAVEVRAVSVGRSVRTGVDGRFALAVVPGFATRVMVRLPGRRPIDTLIARHRAGDVVQLSFTSRRLPQSLDTLKVIAQDECPTQTFEGFRCRRRLGVGAFREGDELDPGNAYTLGNLTWGLEGLRMMPGAQNVLQSTAAWRCLAVMIDGNFPTSATPQELAPEEIIGIEYYAEPDDVPEWYRTRAFARANRGSRARPNPPVRGKAGGGYIPGSSANAGRNCSLLIYWTRYASRFDPKLDQSKAVTEARRRRTLLGDTAVADSMRQHL